MADQGTSTRRGNVSLISRANAVGVTVGAESYGHPFLLGPFGQNAGRVRTSRTRSIFSTIEVTSTDYVEDVAETLTLSEALTFPQTHGEHVFETVTMSEALAALLAVTLPLAETLTLSEALGAQSGAMVALPETLTLSEALTYPQVHGEHVFETLTLGEALAFTRGIAYGLSETLTLAEALSDAASTAIPTGPFSLDLAFSVNLKLAHVDDPRRYKIVSSSTGVQVAVLSATPRRETLASGEDAELVEDGGAGYSRTVYIGQTATVHDRLRLVGAWQDVEVEVVEDLGAGSVRVDKPLLLADPSNGALAWTLYGGVYGASLVVTETTGGAPYTLYVDGLLVRSDGTRFGARLPFTGQAQNVLVVSVVPNAEDGTLVVTFSAPLAIRPDLFDPSLYSVSGATDVVVQAVRQVAPTQVAIQVIGLSADVGAYTLTMPALVDFAQNPVVVIT